MIDQPQLRLPGQQLLGPGALLRGGGLESRLVGAVVAEPRAQQLHQPEPEIGVQRAVHQRTSSDG